MTITLEEMKATLARVSYRHWVIGVHQYGLGEPYLQVTDPLGTCNSTGEPKIWKGRKWRLSYHMTRSELVQTALMAVLAAVEHEARENFTYDGVPVYDPHYDVDALKTLRLREGCLDERLEEAPA